MDKRFPPSMIRMQKKLGHEYRYDKAFCQLLDQGIDPGDAAPLADEKARQPIDCDFGPYEDEL